MISNENAALVAALDALGDRWAADAPAPNARDLAARLIARAEAATPAASQPAQVSRRRPVAAWWPALAAAALLVAIAAWYAMFTGHPEGTLRFAMGSVAATRQLAAGSRIVTGNDGRAVASLDDDRVQLHLRAGTELEILRRDRVRLLRGELWTVVRPASGRFEVATPDASVVVHGTAFGVDAGTDGTEVTIASGKVVVEVAGTSRSLEPGARARVRTGATQPELNVEGGDATPAWAADLMKEYAEALASAYFPSGKPGGKAE